MFLDSVVGKLPVSLQPYAKALVPLVLTVVTVGQDLVLSGVEVNDLAVAVGGAVTSLIVLLVPNKS